MAGISPNAISLGLAMRACCYAEQYAEVVVLYAELLAGEGINAASNEVLQLAVQAHAAVGNRSAAADISQALDKRRSNAGPRPDSASASSSSSVLRSTSESVGTGTGSVKRGGKDRGRSSVLS